MNSLIKKIVLASCGVLFLNSCSPLDGLGSNTQTVNTTIAQPSQYGVVTVPQNTNYVAPTVAPAVPRNYVPQLSSGIGANKHPNF